MDIITGGAVGQDDGDAWRDEGKRNQTERPHSQPNDWRIRKEGIYPLLLISNDNEEQYNTYA